MVKSDEKYRFMLTPTPKQSRWLNAHSKQCYEFYQYLFQEAGQFYQAYVKTKDLRLGNILYSSAGLLSLIPKAFEAEPKFKKIPRAWLNNTAKMLNQYFIEHRNEPITTLSPIFGWFPLMLDEKDNVYHLAHDKLLLFSDVAIAIEVSPLLRNNKLYHLTIMKQGKVYFAEFTLGAKLGEISPEERNLVVAVDDAYALYQVLMEQASGHRQFGTVADPMEPQHDQHLTQNLQQNYEGPPPHPILKDSPYFNGADTNVTPVAENNTNQEVVEAYNELKHTLAAAPAARPEISSAPKPKPG